MGGEGGAGGRTDNVGFTTNSKDFCNNALQGFFEECEMKPHVPILLRKMDLLKEILGI